MDTKNAFWPFTNSKSPSWAVSGSPFSLRMDGSAALVALTRASYSALPVVAPVETAAEGLVSAAGFAAVVPLETTGAAVTGDDVAAVPLSAAKSDLSFAFSASSSAMRASYLFTRRWMASLMSTRSAPVSSAAKETAGIESTAIAAPIASLFLRTMVRNGRKNRMVESRKIYPTGPVSQIFDVPSFQNRIRTRLTPRRIPSKIDRVIPSFDP